jgi:hypothetical protein
MQAIGLIGDYRHDTCHAPQVARLLRHENFEVVEIPKSLPFSVPANRQLVAERFRRSDVLYSIGRNTHGGDYRLLGAAMKKQYVNHWIGSDVLALASSDKRQLVEGVSRHLACAPWIAGELKAHGIDAELVPIISFDHEITMETPPAQHCVLTYLPTGKEEFYGLQGVLAAAKAFPDLVFHVTGNDGNAGEAIANMRYRGWLSAQEMAELYSQCSILLRTPDHDGLSMMVIEAMGKGKEVIYSYDYPHCRVARCGVQIVEVLKEIVAERPRANRQAHDYVTARFSKAIVGTTLRLVFERI